MQARWCQIVVAVGLVLSVPWREKYVEGALRRCGDADNRCFLWEAEGECESNSPYMHSHCGAACDTCFPTKEEGLRPRVSELPGEEPKSLEDCDKEDGTCAAPEDYFACPDPNERFADGTCMETPDPTESSENKMVVRFEFPTGGVKGVTGSMDVQYVPKDEGDPTTIISLTAGGTESIRTFQDHVFQAVDADSGSILFRIRMLPGRETVVLDERHFETDKCIDLFEDCPTRAQWGCSRAPGWMVVHCAKSCNACALRNKEERCAREKLDMAQSPVLRKGDMEERLSSLPDKYNVTVYSESPWIMTFDNFVSDDEITAILKTVDGQWERSTDQGAVNEFGVQEKVTSTGRTSENAWCTGSCERNAATKAVVNRIAKVTGVPPGNFESFQILRYQPGQYYNQHHDMGPSDNLQACGPRIYTFFLYLSDVDEGGATAFPLLNITVKPKKGSALLWPSVLSENPTKQDSRTQHEAQKVIKGEKFAANSWIHLYNYRVPNHWGCTGSFD